MTITCTEKLEEYKKFIVRPLSEILGSFNQNVNFLNEKLSTLSDDVIAEARSNSSLYRINNEDGFYFFRDMVTKLKMVEELILEKNNDAIVYNPLQKSILTDNSIEALFIKSINISIQRLIIHFDELSHDHKITPTKQTSSDDISPSSKSRKRVSSKTSFRLKVSPENLTAAYQVLEENNIVAKGQFDVFKLAFSDKDVSSKVVWNNINSLKYFIDNIYGISVESASEGKWKRTVKCFTSPNGDYKSNSFKGTKYPASSVTQILDKAIRIFNKE